MNVRIKLKNEEYLLKPGDVYECKCEVQSRWNFNASYRFSCAGVLKEGKTMLL